jgi:guanylate kinase
MIIDEIIVNYYKSDFDYLMNITSKLFVVSAPSGAGKTTLVKSLIKGNENIKCSTSHTTRAPRINEKEGEDYFFVSEEEFINLKENNKFIEYAKVFNNYYATSREEIEKILRLGLHAILEIDWQGARQVRQSIPKCISIFILPPSKNVLRKRLINRGADDTKTIELRIKEANHDMHQWSDFDYCIINDDLETAKKEFESIFFNKNEENSTKNLKLLEKINKILYVNDR